MKRTITALTLVALMMLGLASSASAGAPTCSEQYQWKNHGEHVLGYVTAGEVAGGAPAHRDGHAPPGASFCIEQARSGGR